jgi:biotin synthase
MNPSTLAAESATPALRHDWQHGEVASIYRTPLPSLVYRAQTVHRQFHPEDRVQTCQLLSIKTGGCPEDCGYCPQSAHYDAGVGREGLLDPQHVISVAREAAGRGVTRFCMGAAWRQAPEGREFQEVLEMVRGVSELGLEVCCTLGMLNERQAEQLKEAGLSAYNHNLDTSPEFYGSIITTRVYGDRLKTLAAVRKAGITVCCGGILGMVNARKISQFCCNWHPEPHPESVPINASAVEGTLGEIAGARSARNGAGGRDGANPDAGCARATSGRPQTIVSGSGNTVLSCRRELDIRRRKTFDYPKSRAR